MKKQSASFLPPDFSLGQVGQLGQIAKSLANRESSVLILHFFSGTALGHGGTTQLQNVSGRKKHRAIVFAGQPARAVFSSCTKEEKNNVPAY